MRQRKVERLINRRRFQHVDRSVELGRRDEALKRRLVERRRVAAVRLAHQLDDVVARHRLIGAIRLQPRHELLDIERVSAIDLSVSQSVAQRRTKKTTAQELSNRHQTTTNARCRYRLKHGRDFGPILELGDQRAERIEADVLVFDRRLCLGKALIELLRLKLVAQLVQQLDQFSCELKDFKNANATTTTTGQAYNVEWKTERNTKLLTTRYSAAFVLVRRQEEVFQRLWRRKSRRHTVAKSVETTKNDKIRRQNQSSCTDYRHYGPRWIVFGRVPVGA